MTSPLDQALALREQYEASLAPPPAAPPQPTEAERFAEQNGLLGQAAAAGYGLMRWPSAGLADAALTKVVDRYAGPQEAERFGQGVELLKEAYPKTTLGAELLGGLAPSPVKMLSGLKLARAPLGLVGRTAVAAGQLGLEAGAFGAGSEVSEEVLGNEELNAQKIVGSGLLSGLVGAGLGGGAHLGAEGVMAVTRGVGAGIKAAGRSYAERAAAETAEVAKLAESIKASNPDIPHAQAMAQAAETLGKKSVVDSAWESYVRALPIEPEYQESLIKGDHAWREKFLSNEPEVVLNDVGGRTQRAMQDISDASEELYGFSQAPLKRDVIAKNIDPAKHADVMAESLKRAERDLGLIQATKIRARARGLEPSFADLENVEKQLQAHVDKLRGGVPREFVPPPPTEVNVYQPRPYEARPFSAPEFKPSKAAQRDEYVFQREANAFSEKVLQARLDHDAAEAARMAAHDSKEATKLAASEAAAAERRAAHQKLVSDKLAEHETLQEARARAVYKSPADVYAVEDEIKRFQGTLNRRLQRVLESPTSHPNLASEAELTLDALRPAFEERRAFLQDEALFGKMGKIQKDANEALSKAVDLKRYVRSRLFDGRAGGTTDFKTNWLADRGKIDNFIAGLKNPKKDLTNDAIKSWVNANEKYLGVLREHGVLEGTHEAAAIKMDGALKALRDGYIDAEGAISLAVMQKAVAKATGPTSPIAPGKLVGTVMGGTLGPAGAIAGALVGGAADIAKSPMRALRFYHGVKRTVRSFDEMMEGASTKFVGGKGGKGAPSVPLDKLMNMIREVKELASNPEALAARVDKTAGPIYEAAPKHARAIAGAMTRAVLFLAQSAPQDRRQPSLVNRGEPRYSASDIKAYETKAVVAIHGPEAAMALAMRGQLNRHAVEALEAVYPDVYEELRGKVLDKVQDPRTQLSIQQEAMLSVLFKMPVSPSTRPEFIAAMQRTYAASGKSSPAQPAAQGSPLKWGTSVFETPSQKAESR